MLPSFVRLQIDSLSIHVLESYNALPPVDYLKAKVHTCTLKRIDGYDGLGILIATDGRTRNEHFIRDVEIGSPGHRAGLRKNDRLISVNNVNVENTDFSSVLLMIRQGLDKDNLQLSVIHALDSM
jgi:predicted metalloprotease with PDZ domain